MEASVSLLLLQPCLLRQFIMRSLVMLLRLPRSAAADILLWLAEHDAHAADTDLGDFDAVDLLDATEQVERGCRIFHRHCVESMA